MRRLVPKLFCLLLLGPAFAAVETDWTEVNERLVDSHLIPRYRSLTEATDVLSASTIGFCADPDTRSLAQVRRDFHGVMDAWQGIEHLSIGPVEQFMRDYRIKYWPDKHGTGAKQLRALLAARDPERLSGSAFTRASVAVQGLPAFERLLFADKADPRTFGDSDAPDYRCELASAIALNVSEMSRAIFDEWTGGDPSYRERIIMAGAGSQDFASSKEIASQLLTDLSTALQIIEGQKLLRPLGEDVTKARPRRAESWRSRRSLRNIRINLEALRELYLTGYAPLLTVDAQGAELDERIKAAFADSIAAASVQDPLFDMVGDPARRPELERLLALVRTLVRIASVDLPTALDLPVGFNALDGD